MLRGARRWFGELPWSPPDPDTANLGLVRRYLALCAPAAPADIAHFLGARVRDTRRWLDALSDELLAVETPGHRGLVALAADREELLRAPPARQAPRLLPLWDTLLMTHADKTWICPSEAEHKAIWKKAAMVCATVLHQGRVVATWKHKLYAKRIAVTVSPLSGWRKGLLRGVEGEARDLAAHLGRAEAQVTVA